MNGKSLTPSSPNGIDWAWIASKLPTEDLKFQTGIIDDVDGWWIKAISRLRKESIASITASLLRAQARRWNSDWYQSINVRAIASGVPFETMFVRLVRSDETFSDVPPPSPERNRAMIAELESQGYQVLPPAKGQETDA